MAITQKKVRQFLLIGGGIFALSMAYGSGMRAQVYKIKGIYEKYKIYRMEARVAQLAVRGKEAQTQQLEARRLLDVTQDALERGDSDTAKSTLAEVLTRLRTAQQADAATTVDFTGMIADLDKLSLSDKTAAKTSLSSVAAAMDAKLSESSTRLTPTELSAVTIPPPNDNEKPEVGNGLTQIK